MSRLAVARIEEAEALLREVERGAVSRDRPRRRRRALALEQRRRERRRRCRISNDVRVALSTSFEIDFWGRLRACVESARAQALAHALREGRRDALARRADDAGVFLAALARRADHGDARNAGDARRLLAIVQRRSAAGLASDLDVNQALGARADASAQLKELLRQRALVEHLLGTLTGDLDLKMAPGDLAQLPVPPMPPAGLAVAAARAPARTSARPKQNLIAANAQIGVAKAALLPEDLADRARSGGESDDLASLAEHRRQDLVDRLRRWRCRSSPRAG